LQGKISINMVYQPDVLCHPFNHDITAGELYQKTMKRDSEMKELGYNLVIMWESDWFNKKSGHFGPEG